MKMRGDFQCRKKWKDNQFMCCCATLWQFVLGCMFVYFVRYGSESDGAVKENSFHELFGGSGKKTLPNNYYSTNSYLFYFNMLKKMLTTHGFRCFSVPRCPCDDVYWIRLSADVDEKT